MVANIKGEIEIKEMIVVKNKSRIKNIDLNKKLIFSKKFYEKNEYFSAIFTYDRIMKNVWVYMLIKGNRSNWCGCIRL